MHIMKYNKLQIINTVHGNYHAYMFQYQSVFYDFNFLYFVIGICGQYIEYMEMHGMSNIKLV